ncbi:MAG: hypothetical protein HS126_06865 [Anaerolineales bacterium]|nr:hypothetical protein [Anaerolineales bacterium]
MTYQELVSEIKQLPSSEQQDLLQLLITLVTESANQQPLLGSSVMRVRGMLKPDSPLPTDEDLVEDYTRYLIEKYA